MSQLTILNQNDLILNNDIDLSSLPKLFQNYMTAHSEFQIRNFILNDSDFPTDAGKYHQAVRELWARYQNIHNLDHEYKILDNEIQILEVDKEELRRKLSTSRPSLTHDLDQKRYELKIERLEIDINYKKRRLVMLQKQASEIIREMKVFLDVIKTLDQYIPDEYRDETGLPNRELSEQEFWLCKQVSAEVLKDPSKAPFDIPIMTLSQNPGSKLVKNKIGQLVVVPQELLEGSKDD